MRGTSPMLPARAAGRAPGTLRLGAGVVCVLSLSLAGCASTHGNLVAFLRAHEHAVATGHYTVMPPDIIIIHAPVSPEVDGVTERVRPDGKIALRLLGEIDVAGLTTERIAHKIQTLLSRYYVDPEVVVNVRSHASQHYYVFGQVSSPGPKRFTGRDTLLKALADARPNDLAWRSQIRVTRPDPETGESKTITIDLDHMVRTGDVSGNMLLQPGDIIDVPPTPLAWVGLRVRDLLYPVTPALNAYNVPAQAIDSTHIYEDEFGNSQTEDRGLNRYRP